MRLSSVSLFMVILLTGFNAGMGFGSAVGYMPGFEDTPAAHALSYWQHADHYFRARMPIFGNALQLSLLLSLIFLRKQWKSIGYWMLGGALLLSAGELVVILTQNLPLNILMQKLNPDHLDPQQFELIRQKAVKTFYLRSFLSIAAFILSLTATGLLIERKPRV